MSIPAAYITVIVIWSTTPLGIQWSGDAVGYQFGVAARMLISLVLLLAIVRLRRLPLPFDRRAWHVYLVGGLPIFIAMSSVYWSAHYIPSGWISVIFGLSPIVTSLFAMLILREKSFAGGKLLGMLFGVAGLSVVFVESLQFAGHAWKGVAGVMLSMTVHSAGAVLLQRARPAIPVLTITTGSLIVATPLFVLNLAIGPGLPEAVPARTLYAILYLAVFGSTLGFPLYYYLLGRLSAGRVALITLVTPVTALLLGHWLNGEAISTQVWAGTAMILSGLTLYEYGHHVRIEGVRRRFSPRWWQRPM